MSFKKSNLALEFKVESSYFASMAINTQTEDALVSKSISHSQCSMPYFVTWCDMSVTCFFEMLTKSYAPLWYCLNATYTNNEAAAWGS